MTVLAKKIDKYEVLSTDPLIEVFPIPEQPPINMEFRKLITALEHKIKSLPGALIDDCFPLKHKFAKGLYIRELFIPKGYFIVGKLHRDSYMNCFMKGDMTILTESGVRRVKAPQSMVAPAEMKRFGYSHSDVVWVTVHPNPTNSTDIEKLEKEIHIDDYDDLHKTIDITPEVDRVFNNFVKQIAFDPEEFRRLTKEIYAHEKPGFWSDWNKEQKELYASGDWESFSKSRGYSEQEIEILRRWITMKENGEKLGCNPLKVIQDLSMDKALRTMSQDKYGEILKSSHIPSSKKVKYKEMVL